MYQVCRDESGVCDVGEVKTNIKKENKKKPCSNIRFNNCWWSSIKNRKGNSADDQGCIRRFFSDSVNKHAFGRG